MNNVVVTGGSGKLGRAVVAHLVESGWDVVNVDRVPAKEPVAPFVQVDLTDYGQTVSALTAVDDRYSRVDAVVHLAAVPAPGLLPNPTTYANNVTASYNVFAAARQAGIRNVVWASSETVLGLPFDEAPPYLPVDEEYPARPNSSYSLGKHVDEQVAAQFCRWDPNLKMIGLRFSNVMEPADYAAFPGFDADPALRKWNLWGYIDARDGAQAVRRALEYTGTGLEIFIIANADTVMATTSSAELAARVHPDVPVRRELGQFETLLCIDKARRLLGYEPEHSGGAALCHRRLRLAVEHRSLRRCSTASSPVAGICWRSWVNPIAGGPLTALAALRGPPLVTDRPAASSPAGPP